MASHLGANVAHVSALVNACRTGLRDKAFQRCQVENFEVPGGDEAGTGGVSRLSPPRRSLSYRVVRMYVCVYQDPKKCHRAKNEKFSPLCVCLCVCFVCVRNSKIKYFCVYKSEHKILEIPTGKILPVVEKILEIPTGKRKFVVEKFEIPNGENKIRGVVEKILEIPTGKRKFGEIRPTKKIRWLETNALDPHT